MGLFNRKKEEEPQVDPQLSELGRNYAIAKRHGDRRAMSRIVRTVEREYGLADADWASFKDGQDIYDAIPPGYAKPRRGHRR
ncbi:hypothetical protein EKH77_17125 [Streptomyces luteoverticillatus]|uniref:Uncharacterized protein n=1 Tax=Streptomyces luteoverticillatus TaxID=66425 RepID=A0A3Q9FZP7_STRLT|nr:hypothetical protein [Streptomyces luteoverticillatus]AZQ72714.1 hypothetical protein EKH77_17125 [Streptomyces luteoverticillatus]